MNTAKSLIELYNVINTHMGPIEAKNLVADIVFNTVSELQEKNLAVTEEALDEIITKKATDYIEASKNHVA